MNQDFVTRLQLQLREAAEREAGRGRAARGARDALRSPALAAAIAAAALVLAIATGALLLRDDATVAGPRVVERLSLTGNGERILPAFGAVWIADPVAGDIVRVDPDRRAVTARVEIGAHSIAMNAVGRELWAVGDRPDRVLRIDPASARITGRIALRTSAGAPFPALQIVANDRAVWAVSAEGALRLDPRTGAGRRLIARPAGGVEPRWITLGDETLWVYGTDGTIRRFDGATGAPDGRLRPAVDGIQWFGDLGGDLIAMSGEGLVARLDGRTGAVRWQRRAGERLHADGYGLGRIWAYVTRPGRPNRLVALDPRNGAELSATRMPGFGATGLAVVGDEVWVSEDGGRTVVVAQSTR
jgi:outer membrane protein assembly factor BamB